MNYKEKLIKKTHRWGGVSGIFKVDESNQMISPPIATKLIGETCTKWLLYFNGHDPYENELIKLMSNECFWLLDKIMNIDPSL